MQEHTIIGYNAGVPCEWWFIQNLQTFINEEIIDGFTLCVTEESVQNIENVKQLNQCGTCMRGERGWLWLRTQERCLGVFIISSIKPAWFYQSTNPIIIFLPLQEGSLVPQGAANTEWSLPQIRIMWCRWGDRQHPNNQWSSGGRTQSIIRCYGAGSWAAHVIAPHITDPGQVTCRASPSPGWKCASV